MAVNRIYCATGLGDGTLPDTVGDLDNIDGGDLADKDMAIAIDQTTVYFYALDADSAAAHSSPDVIKPSQNAGDKRWILQSLRVNDITISDDVILVSDDITVGGLLQLGTADGTGANLTIYSNTAGDHIVYDPAAKTFTMVDIEFVSNNVDISAGEIDGTTIGANSAAAGNFTNVGLTGTLQFDGVGAAVTGWSGADVTGITGTKGDAGDLTVWNADGDLVSAASPAQANDFLVASAENTWVIKTLAETGAILEGDIDHGNLQGLSTGADHSYIDQDVTSGSTPTFTGTNITAVASITAANEAADATCFPLFVTDASGTVAVKTNAGLAFDSTAGTLTVTQLGAFTATGAINFNTQAMTNVDINSGSIDGVTINSTAIGGSSASTGAFTTVDASTDVTLASGADLILTEPTTDSHATAILLTGQDLDTNAEGTAGRSGGIVYMNASSQWNTADKSATATGGVVPLAMVQDTTAAGDPVSLMVYGFIKETAWSWTVGVPLYLGDDGTFTETAPSTSGDVVRVIGHSIAADIVWFNPSPDWIIVA